MANSADSDQLFRSQLIWIYTVCKGMVYPGSAGQASLGTWKVNLTSVLSATKLINPSPAEPRYVLPLQTV